MKKTLVWMLFVGLLLLNVTAMGQEHLMEKGEEEGASTRERTASTYAYSMGGVNADGDDFTQNVNYAHSIFNSMESVDYAYKNTTPSYTYISGNNSEVIKGWGVNWYFLLDMQTKMLWP